jgi:hypothetical protein
MSERLLVAVDVPERTVVVGEPALKVGMAFRDQRRLDALSRLRGEPTRSNLSTSAPAVLPIPTTVSVNKSA